MSISRWKRALGVLSGVLLVSSAAWGQGTQPPSVVEIDPYAAAAARQRDAAVEAVVARDEALHGRPFDPEYRAAIKGGLAPLSPDALALIPEGAAPLVLGDSAADLVFTPVAPCRIVSFVNIPANSQVDFFVGGLCGIPFGPAVAVVMNFVAVNPPGAGDLRAFPFGSPLPNASVINYAMVPGLNIANGLIVPICNPAVAACVRDVTIYANVSSTLLVIDVYGYFAAQRPLFAVVDGLTGALIRSSSAVSSTRSNPGTYEVIFTRDVTTCAYSGTIADQGTGIDATGAMIFLASRVGNVNGVFIKTAQGRVGYIPEIGTSIW